MLKVCSCLWKANQQSHPFSHCYDESWVEKLYRGFSRNLTRPFKFVCFTDRKRTFDEPIEQEQLQSKPPNYGCFIEPYRLNEPMVLVGLDTVITGNIDHMADYCADEENKLALPRDPYFPEKVCTGVALVPAGNRDVFDAWTGQNDMAWMRIRAEIAYLDDVFPGQVVSFKCHVREHGVGDARIVYFHGEPKMHGLDDPAILAHWK